MIAPNGTVCVGKKGKSGRKTAYEEHHKRQAINTLWQKVNRKVQEGKELSEYEEKLVLAVLPKTIKAEVDNNIYIPDQLLVKIIGNEKPTNNGATSGVSEVA